MTTPLTIVANADWAAPTSSMGCPASSMACADMIVMAPPACQRLFVAEKEAQTWPERTFLPHCTPLPVTVHAARRRESQPTASSDTLSICHLHSVVHVVRVLDRALLRIGPSTRPCPQSVQFVAERCAANLGCFLTARGQQ